MNSFIERVSRKINIGINEKLGKKRFYKCLFSSYWHKVICDSKTVDRSNFYIAPGINYGAGIGHQMYDWASQYQLVKKMGLSFAHKSLWVNGIHAEKDDAIGIWNQILGLGEGEKKLAELLDEGYKVVRLPVFGREYSVNEELAIAIMDSYCGQKVVFQLAIDQPGIMDGVAQIFYDKFWNAKARENKPTLLYDSEKLNIAVHIRRGDVSEKLPYKFRTNTFYYQAVMDILSFHKEIPMDDIQIYIFSEGEIEDYPEFMDLNNVTFCLDMDSKKTFMHLVNADILVVAPSWFSANAAAINRRELYCSDEYHKYDDELNWIWLDKDGHIKK